MARVELAGGAAGSDVALSGADQVFYVETGTVEFSTDAGTTYIPFAAPDKVVFSDGLTVKNRNPHSTTAAFRHMPL